MKRTTLALAVSLILFVGAASAAEFPDYPFVHASGTGFTYVAPDLGEIDFEISVLQADPESARQAIEARVAALRAVLDGAGITAADVEIRDVRREMKRDTTKTDPTQLVYLKCGVHIKVTDLSKWKTVVGPLIAMPDLDGFMTGFDSSRREAIETELSAEALKNARRRAEAMAAGVGRKLGLASAVSAGDLKNVTRAVGLGGALSVSYRNPGRADVDREGLLMIVPMKLSQSVDVIYRFK